ncbi:MAG: RNA polymerase sigma factor [Hyphomonadaceae bacterium]
MTRSPDRILDEFLVLHAQAGERAAFEQLAARWTPRLIRHAARLLGATDEARDAVQDAWAGIARGLRTLDDPARFPAWAYAIATRKCADAIRAKAKGRRIAQSAAHDAALNGASIAPASEAEAGLDLSRAIARLPADQRLVVSLHYGEDLPLDEIAAITGAPEGTIKSRLHAARQTLKRIMEGETP